jgi:ribosomal protein S18 acetylase RimI-like enzyme
MCMHHLHTTLQLQQHRSALVLTPNLAPGSHCHVQQTKDGFLEFLQVAGYVFCTVRSLVLHVGKLAVVPDFRRQGLGRALLQVCS